MPIAEPQFYAPLPIYGRRLDRQWDLFRDDFNSLAPIVRAAHIDVNANNDSEHDLSGMSLGELDFRHRYRTFYDKTTDAYLIQYNTGTEGAPVWVTRVTIRDSDGRMTVNSPGGFLSVGGFYNFNGVDVKESQAGGASFASAGTIIFDSTSGFYLTPDSTGKPIVSISVEAAAGTVTDGTNVGSQAGVFKDKSGTTLRFRSLAGSGLLTATENANTIDFATSAENNTGSNLGSGTGVFESKVASDLRFKSLVGTGGLAISATASEITLDSSANKFYGVTFKESESGGRVERDDTLVFDSAAFYLGQAGDDGKPMVSLQPEISLGKLNVDGFLNFLEVSEPATPDSTHGVMWAADENGFTVLNIKGNNVNTIQISRDNVLIVRNASGSTIAAGSAVYISGSTGQVPQVSLAKADSLTTMPAIGITPSAISNNSFGLVYLTGVLNSVDLSGFSDGDDVWVSPSIAGALTSTKPGHPNLHQHVGYVLSAGSSGTLLVHVDVEDGDDVGTNQTSFTIGTTSATSAVLQPNSTAQRTFTFPDKSGTVALTNDVGPAFYGLLVKESESGGFSERDDTLVFNSEHFYVTQDADAKPLVSLGAASVGTNLGNGQGVYASQLGLQLRFKSLTSTGKIKLTSNSNEINIAGEFYLDDLLDVDAGAPKNGQLLAWNSSTGNWEATDTPQAQINTIINGNLDIWQRGTSFDKIDNFKYGPDRFAFFYAGGTGVDGIDIDRDATLIPDGLSEFSMKLTVDTADTSIGSSETYAFFQGIEGHNIQQFGFGSSDAKVATLSFYVRSSVAGTYCIFLKNALEGAAARTQIKEYQINAANTWEFKEITFTADTAGTWEFTTNLGLVVGWTLACGSSLQTTPNAWAANGAYGTEHQVNWLATAGNTFNIARVQLEVGSFATVIRSLVVDELHRCQRYFSKTFRTATTPADGLGTTGAMIGKGANGSVDIEPLVNWFLPVTMRVVPTVTLFNTRSGGAIGQWQIGSTGDGANARVISTSETLVVIDNTGIPLAAGSQAFIHATSDAEF